MRVRQGTSLTLLEPNLNYDLHVLLNTLSNTKLYLMTLLMIHRIYRWSTCVVNCINLLLSKV